MWALICMIGNRINDLCLVTQYVKDLLSEQEHLSFPAKLKRIFRPRCFEEPLGKLEKSPQQLSDLLNNLLLLFKDFHRLCLTRNDKPQTGASSHPLTTSHHLPCKLQRAIATMATTLTTVHCLKA